MATTLLCVAPAEGVERWAEPQALGSVVAPEYFDAPVTVFDADGNATAAWQRNGGATDALEAAIRPAGGAFAAMSPPAPSGSANLVLAEGRSGVVFAAWELTDDQGDQFVQTSVRGPGGGWTPPVLASAAGASQPAIGVDGGGTGFVAWERVLDTSGDVNVIESRDIAPDGSLGVTHEVARDNDGRLSGPLIAGDDAGAVTVVYSRESDSDVRLEARGRATATGIYERAPVLVATTYDSPFADLAVTPAGDAVVSYLGGPDGNEVFAAVRRGLGAFTAQRMSDPESDVPRIERGGSGVIVVWPRTTVDRSLVEARGWSPGGGFGPTETVASFDGDLPLVAAPGSATGGDASIVWSRVTAGASPDFSDDHALIQARTRHADGSYADLATVATFGPGEIEALEADRDDHGNAIALWTRADPMSDQDADGTLEGDADDRFLVEYAGLDGEPPRVTRFTAPPSGPPGQPLAFGVSGTDVWSPVTIAWTFGDAGPGSDQSDPVRAFPRVGDYTVTVQLADNIANGTTRTARVAIGTDQPPPPPIAPPPPADTTPPSLGAVGFSSACVSTALVSARPERGPLRLRFNLSEAATIQYVIRRRLGSPGRPICPRRMGRRPGRAEPIVDGTLSLPAGPSAVQLAARSRRCAVRVPCAGTRPTGRVTGRPGPNSVRLAALLGGRRLSPGTYSLLLRAADSAGNRSPDLAIKFWVLRAR